MSEIGSILSWSYMVLRKGLWVLGFLPQLLDFLSTYIPDDALPAWLASVLEKGGNWSLTIILIPAGFIVSSYLVFRDSELENRRLDASIHSLQDSGTEQNRRRSILARLRQKYILSHDGITPGMASGLEALPKEWVERELGALGETWRQDEYY